MTRIFAVLMMMATGLASAAAVDSKKALYRWTDEKGQVHYGDKVPPQEAKQGREAINNQGTVLKVVPKQLEGAELEKAQAKAREEKAEQDAAAQRVAYDRYLLSSFGSVADLQASREERLTALDGRITLAQKAVDDNEKTLADLRGRASNGKPDAKLQSQLDTYDGALIDNLQAVRKLKQERAATEEKYALDIDRFKKLRAGTIHVGD
jgi:hypothetical protein